MISYHLRKVTLFINVLLFLSEETTEMPARKKFIKILYHLRTMATVTVTVPEDFKIDMEKHKLINWSAVAREAIRLRLNQLRVLEAIAGRSQVTKKDAVELGRKVRAGIHERHVKAYGV